MSEKLFVINMVSMVPIINLKENETKYATGFKCKTK